MLLEIPDNGLHFSDDILASLSRKGIEKVELSLQIGLGTFQPIRVNNIDEHNMHSEQWTLDDLAFNRLYFLFMGKSLKLIARRDKTVKPTNKFHIVFERSLMMRPLI